MAAVREVDEGHVHVESFVLSVDAEDQQLLAPLGQGFSAALAGARPTAAAVAPATAARRDTTMGMRNALAAARTARRTVRKNMLCEIFEKGSVESTHKVPTSHYPTKHCHAAVVALGGLTHFEIFATVSLRS